MAQKKGQTSVTIYQDWCKGCGLCVAFCPAKVMELNSVGKAEVIREEECINCGFCELHCPDFAIVVSPLDGSAPPDYDASSHPVYDSEARDNEEQGPAAPPRPSDDAPEHDTPDHASPDHASPDQAPRAHSSPAQTASEQPAPSDHSLAESGPKPSDA